MFTGRVQFDRVKTFSALHGMPARTIAMRKPSVCPSDKYVDCNKTEERSVQILYHTKDHLAKFSGKKNGW